MGSACNANVSTYTDTNLDGVLVKAIHINELKQAIYDEESRRSISHYPMTAVSAGTVISDDDTRKLKDASAKFKSMNWNQNYVEFSGEVITADRIEELRQNVADAENDCLCNCNYCTCNCNYCTCNCNYCTCNCNYCTCNCHYCTCDTQYTCVCDCNYSCTCDCNYSCTCDCQYTACPCDCNYSCTCDCQYACTCDTQYSCTCDCQYG